MYGNNMGTLNVYLSQNGSSPGTKVWALSGNQQNRWNAGTVALKSSTQYSVSLFNLKAPSRFVAEDILKFISLFFIENKMSFCGNR